MKRVRCPFCSRTLFWTTLPWVVCLPEQAIVSIRCPRRPAWKCGEFISLRLLSLAKTQFEDEAVRAATAKKMRQAVET
jgi:hypothetical protein